MCEKLLRLLCLRNRALQLNRARGGRGAGLFAKHRHAVAGLQIRKCAAIGLANQRLVVHFDRDDAGRCADFNRVAVDGFDLTARDTITQLREIAEWSAECASVLSALALLSLKVALSGLPVGLPAVAILRKASAETAWIIRGELPTALRAAALSILNGALLQKCIRGGLRLRLRVGHAAEKAAACRENRNDDGANNYDRKFHLAPLAFGDWRLETGNFFGSILEFSISNSRLPFKEKSIIEQFPDIHDKNENRNGHAHRDD